MMVQLGQEEELYQLVDQHLLGAFGTQTAAAAVSGSSASPAVPGGLHATEEYNGSTWSGGGAVPTAGYAIAGCGTQTAGLGFGGYNPSLTSTTLEYDGSAWTAGGKFKYK
jgi:hypothetical protein